MFYANTFTLKMENKKMATKALEVMKEALAQIVADGFKYDSRKTVDDFANDLMVKGSEVIAEETVDSVMAELEEMILISKCHSMGYRYPTIKAWFLDKYPEIAAFGMDDEQEAA